MNKRHRIEDNYKNSRPKCKYKKPHPEGYGSHNGEFVFSSDLNDWLYGPTRRGERYKDLF